MYKLVLFDLDGTLTQSEFGIFSSVQYALEKFGIHETEAKNLRRFIGPPLYVSFSEFYGLDGEDGELAVKYYRSVYEKDGYKEAPVYDGVKELLASLKDEGKTLMVVTSKPQEMAERVIEHVGVASYFDAIVGPGREMNSPSKKELITKALGIAGSDGSDAIMVGDRKFDIEGACGAGIDSIGVLYGYGSREELEAAGSTYIVDTPDQVLSLI
jgi:phosphoglycolate phosphatase